MSSYDLMSTDELSSFYSDYFKDTHGFRPRFAYSTTRADYINLITELDNHFLRMKETFAGRETLREQGWVIPETDPEYIQRAEWLKQERDRMDERF